MGCIVREQSWSPRGFIDDFGCFITVDSVEEVTGFPECQRVLFGIVEDLIPKVNKVIIILFCPNDHDVSVVMGWKRWGGEERKEKRGQKVSNESMTEGGGDGREEGRGRERRGYREERERR